MLQPQYQGLHQSMEPTSCVLTQLLQVGSWWWQLSLLSLCNSKVGQMLILFHQSSNDPFLSYCYFLGVFKCLIIVWDVIQAVHGEFLAATRAESPSLLMGHTCPKRQWLIFANTMGAGAKHMPNLLYSSHTAVFKAYSEMGRILSLPPKPAGLLWVGTGWPSK